MLILIIFQVMNFSDPMVATFIAVVGILSVVAQTALLSLLMKKLSNKHVIMVSVDGGDTASYVQYISISCSHRGYFRIIR